MSHHPNSPTSVNKNTYRINKQELAGNNYASFHPPLHPSYFQGKNFNATFTV